MPLLPDTRKYYNDIHLRHKLLNRELRRRKS
jgi:hypothetical protein